ncbi:uncharacterized protein EAF02_002459 [Botrytis sinoallii]|uniref:uncharacterized protein n=1 Tax=Botrytis sinoallii TaxID=1463999 RepID=UPI001901902D|nr:uncharacterized protein EAF02_002459 [Botrytis sinoallii]KAF7890044.1 hypothetical protein EAF02_002459 [Botrytis sinoallii]
MSKSSRRWVSTDIELVWKHDDAIAWYKAQYGVELKKSTISDLLSKKFEWFDTTELTKYELSQSKTRPPAYPALEEALLEWQIRYDRHPDAGPTTGDVLRLKATEFWQKLSEYKDKPLPFDEGKTWSTGFIDGFKKRSSMKERRRFGEGASADIGPESEAIMEEIRRIAALYDADDVYNCDETGLFWRDRPDRTLSTFESAGRKKEKARLTALLTSNSTGTHKLPLWIIGKARTPQAFRREGLTTLDGLGVKYRSNAKFWMNNGIFAEYLIWFDGIMRQMHKKALLIMDNFFAHELAVTTLIEAGKLRNTKIIWLPPNSTSKHQPLDQGIIQNWKLHLRRRSIRFMVQCFDKDLHYSKELDILLVIRWGILAWEDVKTSTISNCWDKSQCINLGSQPATPLTVWQGSEEALESLRLTLIRLKHQGIIASVPDDIREYISPYSERIIENDDNLDTLVDDIIEAREMVEVDEEDEKREEEVKPPISHFQALEAIQILIKYQEQQGVPDMNAKFITSPPASPLGSQAHVLP